MRLWPKRLVPEGSRDNFTLKWFGKSNVYTLNFYRTPHPQEKP